MFRASACFDNRQIVGAVDHRLALSNPAMVSAPSKKIVLQRQLADLGMQRLHVDRWCRLAAARTEHIGSPALKLRLPRGNLIGERRTAPQAVLMSDRP